MENSKSLMTGTASSGSGACQLFLGPDRFTLNMPIFSF